MGHRHLETERSFDPPTPDDGPDRAALPDLTLLPGVETVQELAQVELAATYVDTIGLDLLRHGVTLRRREGGHDEGWHLKLPVGGDTREEVRAPLGEEGGPVPDELAGLVVSLTLGQPLAPIAILRTHRNRTLLRRGTTTVAEVADDLVTAGTTVPGATPQVRVWREWEVELVEGGPELLDDVEEALLAAGATPAEQSSKLVRALGEDAPGPRPVPRRPKPAKPAARVLHHYLDTQVVALLAADRAVRVGDEEGVHDLRVALRRIRAALATWRPLVDREVTDPLRDRMSAVAQRLGAVRDNQVVHGRLLQLMADEPADLALGEARRLVTELAVAGGEESRRGAAAVLADPDYLPLLGVLRNLVEDPPWTEGADAPAADMVRARLRQEVRRVRSRVAALEGVEGADHGTAARSGQLHEVRKAAKRLRYAAEAARPVAGHAATKLRSTGKRLQGILGDHHETVLVRAELVRLAGRGDLHSGTGFTLGRLHAREEQEAARLEREAVEAWRRLVD